MPAPPPKPKTTFVLDNGASTLKAGFVHDGTISEPRVIPNCIARDRTRKVYVASELDKCTDYGEIQFRRPVEKGFIVNWEVQSEIWDYEFFGSKAPVKCDPSDTRLVLAEPPSGLPVLQANCDHIVFEEYGFESYYRGVGRSNEQTRQAATDTDFLHRPCVQCLPRCTVVIPNALGFRHGR